MRVYRLLASTFPTNDDRRITSILLDVTPDNWLRDMDDCRLLFHHVSVTVVTAFG